MTTDNAQITAVREVVQQFDRLERNPGETAHVQDLLQKQTGPLMTGFLVGYLIDRDSVRDPNRADAVLSSLLGTSAVARLAGNDIANALAGDCYRLSDAARKTVAENLVATAAGTDHDVARYAFSALVRMANSGLVDMKTYITPARRERLAENYRTLLSEHRIPKASSSFETDLGVGRTQ